MELTQIVDGHLEVNFVFEIRRQVGTSSDGGWAFERRNPMKLRKLDISKTVMFSELQLMGIQLK